MISAPPFLEVATLGRFEVRHQQNLLNGGNWNRRKVCELFKLLISAEQHRLHREQIQEILWPSSASEQAASSFGKTLYLLRRALEPELATGKGGTSTYLVLDHDTLLLVPNTIGIDADRFESSAKQLQIQLRSHTLKGEQNEDEVADLLGEFDRVLSLYRGDYLPEDLYEDWSHRRRDRLRRIHSWLLENAAELSVACSMGQRACEYLQALLEQNNTDEQTHRQLMLVYARMGRRREALNQFYLLREALKAELRTEPLPETHNLYRAILAGNVREDLASPLGQLSAGEAQRRSDLLPGEHEGSIPAIETIQASPPERSSRPALPALEPSVQVILLERDEEMLRLHKAFAQAQQGQHRVFVISGEPGIGKTRLAHDFAQQVATRTKGQEATILWGYCYEIAGPFPYQPISDAIQACIRGSDAATLRRLLGSNAADLAKIVPEIRIHLPDLPPLEAFDPEVERRNLYNAVAHFLHALAAERPTIIILDDLQWADAATIQLLSYLTSLPMTPTSFAPLPLYILLYRADEVHEHHPLRGLLTVLSRFRSMDEARLKRLSVDAVQQLLSSLAGRPTSPLFVSEIYRHSEGNPFFIIEALISLVHEGKIMKVGEQWQAVVGLDQLELPQSVRLLIERRLMPLSPEARTTLALAALLGRQFSSSLLCTARNLSEETVAEHVDEAIRLYLLVALSNNGQQRQDEDLSFTHDKIREVLYLSLNPLRRRTFHRQVAQAMEKYYTAHPHPHYSQLAHHYQMAEEYGRAVEYFLKAAHQAASIYAFVDTADCMEKALELLISEEDQPLRAEILRQLAADIYLYIGRPGRAIETGMAACSLWHKLGNVEKEAETWLDVAFALHWQGREEEAIECIQRALTGLEQRPGERRLLAKAHAQWGLAATNIGDTKTAREQMERAEELHTHIGGNDPFISVVTLWARSWYSFLAETPQKMLEYAQQAAQVCRDTRRLGWEPMATYSAAWAYMLLGKIDESKNAANETLEKAQRFNAVGAQGWAYLVLSFIAIQQARWQDVQLYSAKAQEIASMLNDRDLQARLLWGRSMSSGRQGDWEAAVSYSREGLRVLEQKGVASLIYPYLLVQAARTHLQAGMLQQAQQYLEQGMTIAQQRDYQHLPMLAWRVQGRILQEQGNFEAAQSAFEQSLSLAQKREDFLQYNLTLEAYGEFFLARKAEGDHERGQSMIESAWQTFSRMEL
jgi:predicted ATPase/DNA-binding SARP family transcriptional activator